MFFKHFLVSGKIFEDCEEEDDLENKNIHEDDLPALFTRVLSKGLFVYYIYINYYLFLFNKNIHENGLPLLLTRVNSIYVGLL